MKKYSFTDGTLFINGVPISGFADGDNTVTFARRNDSANDIVGADGEMSVNISADRSGTCVLRLMQTSDANAYMSQLINAQENGIFVPLFVQYKDSYNVDLVSGTQGYINKPADVIRGNGVTVQEWTMTIERLDILHLGGIFN